jgi:hypothetical protein
MYDIYDKRIEDGFAGSGTESLIVKDGIILAHNRGWDNPSVVAKNWSAPLQGQPIKATGKGWTKLRGFQAENAQPWARDILNYYGVE